MAFEAVLPIIQEKAQFIKSDRVRTFVNEIINNGMVFSHALINEHGIKQPAKVAQEAKEIGFPIISYKEKSVNGKLAQAYKFPNSERFIRVINDGFIWKDEKIRSIRSFIEAIDILNLDEDSEYSYFFRGHSNHHLFKLEPSIYRKQRWIDNEHRMFREIIIKCPVDFSKAESTFEKLVKMQHYSLPTRLLDITENPLVALFFSCLNDKEEDGEVIVFRVPKRDIKYYDSDTVSVVSNLSKRPECFDISNIINKDEDEFNSSKEIKYLLHEIKEEKPYFEPNIVAKHINSVVCVKPKLDNPRIIRQDGAFFLFGIDNAKSKRASIPEEYRVTDNELKLIVNKNDKKKILKELTSLGISDAKMFPEIDSVSNHLKSNFKMS